MPTYSLNIVQKKPYFLRICKATPATVKTVAEVLRTSRLIDVNVIFVNVLDGFLKQDTMDILILTTLIGLFRLFLIIISYCITNNFYYIKAQIFRKAFGT